MRKSATELTLNSFLGWIELYTSIADKLIIDKTLFTNKEEKIEIIESLVLKICALWGVLVEDLLIDCLNKDSTKYADFIGDNLPKHIPRTLCTTMIQGLGYFDFKGTPDIKRIAKSILVHEHNPFKEISSGDGKKIDELYKFRNFIAHLSTYSARSLEKIYFDKYRMKRFQDPGSFLMAIDKKTKKPRLNSYIEAMHSAVDDMAICLGLVREPDSE